MIAYGRYHEVTFTICEVQVKDINEPKDEYYLQIKSIDGEYHVVYGCERVCELIKRDIDIDIQNGKRFIDIEQHENQAKRQYEIELHDF